MLRFIWFVWVAAVAAGGGSPPPHLSIADIREASPALRRSLADAEGLGTWDGEAAALTWNQRGQLTAVRFNSRGETERVVLEAPRDGWAEPRLLGASGDWVLVRSFGDLYLYHMGKVAREFHWPRPAAAAALGNARLAIFPNPSPFPDPGEVQPLVKVCNLEGDDCQVFAELEANSSPDAGPPVFAARAGVFTSQGWLWTVGLYSGAWELFDVQGRVRVRGSLQLAPLSVSPEEKRRHEEALVAEKLGDATRRPPTHVSPEVPARRRLVVAWGQRGGTLVLLAETGEGPLLALVDRSGTHTLRLPAGLHFRQAAVTDEGIWLVPPLRLLPWEAVDGVLSKLEKVH